MRIVSARDLSGERDVEKGEAPSRKSEGRLPNNLRVWKWDQRRGGDLAAGVENPPRSLEGGERRTRRVIRRKGRKNRLEIFERYLGSDELSFRGRPPVGIICGGGEKPEN